MTPPTPRRHRPPRRPAGNRGFTLVEVLVALVLMGIVLPVAMRGITIATRASSVARHMAEAANLGEAKLTEMVAQGDWASTTQGDFPDFPAYRWTLESVNRDFDLTELRMAVIWKDRGQDRSLYVSTFVYDANAFASSGTGTGTGSNNKKSP
jgi:prepilin-type N-terminal cleavage/methylation domain-containing protein